MCKSFRSAPTFAHRSADYIRRCVKAFSLSQKPSTHLRIGKIPSRKQAFRGNFANPRFVTSKAITTTTNENMTRNIQDIAPLLADHFVDFESDVKTFEENNKLVADNAQRLGLYHKYLGLLHDSWNIKTNITTDKFSITLNEFTTQIGR